MEWNQNGNGMENISLKETMCNGMEIEWKWKGKWKMEQSQKEKICY